MEKLLLVDGSNLLFQMFYGMPSRIINKEGKPIQGILGFVGALRKIITATQPTHICVLFDGEHENPRNTFYKEYKANRIDYSTMPVEDTPFQQLPDIYKALDFLNIPFKEIQDFEVDDYIASYTKTYQTQMEIVIASWDSDYFSLINERVKIYRYRGKKSYICDKQYLKDKLHITPDKYIFYKSLVGDSADNIKGIYKIGPVTAAKLVNCYASIE
ncbi:MAG: flap endonuclease, partial [Roseburia sp.]|nr:flap endonuclease [Roseburia sp.]